MNNELNVLKSITLDNEEQKRVLNKIIKELEEKENKSLFGGSRVAGIKKLMKNVEKYRNSLVGYSEFEDMCCFTDSYILVLLKDNLNYSVASSPITQPTIKTLINGTKNKLYIDNDILASMISRSEENVEIEGIKLDKEKLKLLLKIMGKCVDFYIMDNILYVENNNHEIGILIGRK